MLTRPELPNFAAFLSPSQPTQNSDERFHVIRQRALETHFFAGYRMFEAEYCSVERLAREGGDGGRGFVGVRAFGFEGALLAIERIAHEGRAEMGEMRADLVRASGV